MVLYLAPELEPEDILLLVLWVFIYANRNVGINLF